MKNIFLLLSILFLFSCSNTKKDEELKLKIQKAAKAQIEKYIKEANLQDKSGYTQLDSVSIIQIDSIDSKELLTEKKIINLFFLESTETLVSLYEIGAEDDISTYVMLYGENGKQTIDAKKRRDENLVLYQNELEKRRIIKDKILDLDRQIETYGNKEVKFEIFKAKTVYETRENGNRFRRDTMDIYIDKNFEPIDAYRAW